MRTLKFILLPLLGIIAAVIAFRIAAPFEGTLNRPDLGDDPRALFTYGTKWGEANRLAFGALLCGPFAVVLALGRRSVLHVLLAGIIGSVLGALVNFVTDSGADIIGIAVSSKRAGAGPFVGMAAWCLLVPLGVGFTLVMAQGPTAQRIRRAVVAFKWAAATSFVVQLVGGMVVAQDAGGEINLQSQIPAWRMVEIAVGLAFGLTILAADEYIRTGTIRLLHGRNEYVDWSLDYPINRIGSAEGCEIYVRGFKGVAPLHAQIVNQGSQFVLQASSPTQVNGASVTQATLKSSDVIAVGDAQLVFTSNMGFPYFSATSTQPPGAQQSVVQQPSNGPQSLGQQAYPQQPYGQNPMPQQPYLPQAPGQQPIYTAAPPQPRLQDAFGRQIPLSPGRYGMGQSPNNAFCFQHDPQVSPMHAEMLVTDQGITVTDLHSAIGTLVNGVRISGPTPLRPGDTVDIGASRFTYLW